MLYDFGSSCLCYFTLKCHRFLFHLNSTLTTAYCFADGSIAICVKWPLLWFQAPSVSPWKMSSGVTPWPQLVFHCQELLWLALCICDLPPVAAGKGSCSIFPNETGIWKWGAVLWHWISGSRGCEQNAACRMCPHHWGCVSALWGDKADGNSGCSDCRTLLCLSYLGEVCSWSCNKCSGCFIVVLLPSCACYLLCLPGPLAAQPWEQLWLYQGQQSPNLQCWAPCVCLWVRVLRTGWPQHTCVSHPLSLVWSSSGGQC